MNDTHACVLNATEKKKKFKKKKETAISYPFAGFPKHPDLHTQDIFAAAACCCSAANLPIFPKNFLEKSESTNSTILTTLSPASLNHRNKAYSFA